MDNFSNDEPAPKKKRVCTEDEEIEEYLAPLMYLWQEGDNTQSNDNSYEVKDDNSEYEEIVIIESSSYTTQQEINPVECDEEVAPIVSRIEEARNKIIEAFRIMKQTVNNS